MTSLVELFDGAGDGVAVIDAGYRIVYWNAAAKEIVGYSRDEALGHPCFDIFRGMGERGTIVCGPECSIMSCAFRGDRIHSFNLLTNHKDGRRLWLNVSTMYLSDFDGHANVVVHMFRDIDRLGRAEELLGEFLIRGLEVAAPVPLPQRIRAEQREKLTKREREVLQLVAQGLNAKDIARRLTVSEATARNHIQNILSKLGVHSRLEAALYAIEHGIAQP